MAAAKPLITIKNLNKEFPIGRDKIHILKDVSIDIDEDKFVILFGPSGCGKSTLLHTMIGLEKPTSGTVSIANIDLHDKTEDELSDFRLEKIGIVYQRPDWIRSLTVVENISFPLAVKGVSKNERVEKALKLLKQFDLVERAYFKPTELSGGQQQKVEIARALINDPEILVADEPTGNLDTNSAAKVMQMFKDLNEKHNLTIIMVTHNMEYVQYASQTVYMRDGKILSGTEQFLS